MSRTAISRRRRALGQDLPVQTPADALAWGPAQVAIAGATIVTAGFLASWFGIYSFMRTGDPRLDRFAIRGRLAFWALLKFGPKAFDAAIPRALMAIVHQESRGDPANYLGDTGIAKCPSVGPMQICRATAAQYKLVSPDETYEQFSTRSQDEATGIRWGVTVFKHKLDEHGGDVGAAIRAYNGSGPDAEKYRAQVETFTAQTWA